MTIEQVIKEFVAALEEYGVDPSDTVNAFGRYNPREIVREEDRTVFSIALNDDTTDVRYVMLDGGSGYIGEVVPKQRVVTEYVQV